MKLSLVPRLQQKLRLTPQLQFALRLLQLPTLDLRTEIQHVLETNPLLEAEEELSEIDGDDLRWKTSYNNVDNIREFNLLLEAEEPLKNHLRWQADVSHFSEKDYAIAIAIIDAMTPEGYFCGTRQEIQDGLGQEISLSDREIDTVLHVLQNFDPPGVCARNLAECLLIQLRQLSDTTPSKILAQQIIATQLSQLAQHHYRHIQRELHITSVQLQDALQLIHSLKPHPGAQLTHNQSQYIIPDMLVKKQPQGWSIEMNTALLPKLHINPHYLTLLQKTSFTPFQEQLKEARWLLKSLQHRQDTLLKVVNCILAQQQRFLEQGPTAIEPLTLQAIAKPLGIHISTVSRVISQKYIATPYGILALKHFFSRTIPLNHQEKTSAAAVQARLRHWISSEAHSHPLNDESLVKLLTEEGIHIARRTVAKYRKVMKVPSAQRRRR